MKNFVQPGNAIYLVAPSGGVVSGRAYVIGAFAGVAAISADAGDQFPLNVVGVYALPKKTGVTLTRGEVVFLDNADGKVTDTSATGLFKIGVCAGDEEARGVPVRLDGHSVAAV